MAKAAKCSCGQIFKLPESSTATSAKCPACGDVINFRKTDPIALAAAQKPQLDTSGTPENGDFWFRRFPWCNTASGMLYLFGNLLVYACPLLALVYFTSDLPMPVSVVLALVTMGVCAVTGVLLNCLSELIPAIAKRLNQ